MTTNENKEFLITGNCTYKIIREIARGGMAIVYEANQLGVEGFRKRVAFKEIRSSFTEDNHFVDLFIGEAKLVADLVHQNIVQIYHLGKRGNKFYIVMEHIDGINLEDFLKYHRAIDRQVPVEIGAFITSRICRGLGYAHDKKDSHGQPLGIVHRDVSPKNIMITHEGEVKLTDFGIAKARRYMAIQSHNFFLGKAAYMSPEQARSETTDMRSDVFSTGVLLYRMLTDLQPFEDKNSGATIQNVLSKEVIPAAGLRFNLPARMAEIIEKAMERDRDKRFQSAHDMGYALEHYMYHDRFGPTNLTLKAYMEKLLPQPQAILSEALEVDDDTLATPLTVLS